jgi:hypothetical protein
MWHRVAKLMVPDRWKEHGTFIFRVKQSSLLELPDPEYEGTTFLLNTSSHYSSDVGITFQKTLILNYSAMEKNLIRSENRNLWQLIKLEYNFPVLLKH